MEYAYIVGGIIFGVLMVGIWLIDCIARFYDWLYEDIDGRKRDE